MEREIFFGDVKNLKPNRIIRRKSLEIIQVMQHLKMKEIEGWGTRGKGRPHFQGAIVAVKYGDSTMYLGVSEGRFMINDPCYAKHGVHDTADWLVAKKKTGSVEGFTLILWDSKPHEWALVPDKCTLNLRLVQQKSRYLKSIWSYWEQPLNWM